MSLVVEDGSIVAGAESYVSVADADTYWTARGNTDWTGLTTAQKEQHLRIATARLDKRYRWLGTHTNETTQVLEWPRYLIEDHRGRWYDSDEIPQPLKDAVCELANQNRIASLDVTRTSRKVLSERLGPMSATYTGWGDDTLEFPWIDDLVEPLTVGGGAGDWIRA